MNPELAKHLPAIPREFALALAQGAVALAVSFGAPLTQMQQTELVSFSALVATLLVAGGTALRRGRAKHLAPVLSDMALMGDVAAKRPHTLGLDLEKRPVARQLTAVADAGDTAAAAQEQNDPDAPQPGTYPLDDEPAGDEPTGS